MTILNTVFQNKNEYEQCLAKQRQRKYSFMESQVQFLNTVTVAQRQTRNRKVAGSITGRNGGRIFLSFHHSVMAAARQGPRQVTAKDP